MVSDHHYSHSDCMEGRGRQMSDACQMSASVHALILCVFSFCASCPALQRPVVPQRSCPRSDSCLYRVSQPVRDTASQPACWKRCRVGCHLMASSGRSLCADSEATLTTGGWGRGPRCTTARNCQARGWCWPTPTHVRLRLAQGSGSRGSRG